MLPASKFPTTPPHWGCELIANDFTMSNELLSSFIRALANVQAHIGTQAPSTAEDVNMEDSAASGVISKEAREKIEATTAVLSQTRRRKPKVTAEQVQTYSQRKVFPGLHAARTPGITALDISVDQNKGDLILTGGQDKNAMIFSQSEEKVVSTLKGHGKKITHVAWNEQEGLDHDVVLTSSEDHTVKIWTASGSKSAYSAAHTIKGHQGSVTGLCVHPTKAYLASASMDSTWAFHDIETGSTMMTAHSGDVVKGYSSASFHPDGLLFGTGTAESGAVKIWDIRTKEAVANFEGHHGSVRTMTFSENGYLMAAAGENNEVSIWNLRTMDVVQKLQVAEGGQIQSLAWDQSGTYLGVGGTDIRIFKVKTWQELATLTDNTADITSLKFGPLGDYLVAGGMDRSLRVFGITE